MFEYLPIKNLWVKDNRQRHHISEAKLIDLCDSIESKGLIHAIVVNKEDNSLMVGERRTQAIQRLHQQGKSISYLGKPIPEGTIPAFFHEPGLSELELEEIELAENLDRENLTWQEESAAHARLHQLRLQQTEGKQTIKATAEELASRKSQEPTAHHADDLSTDLILSSHLDDEDVRRAKSKKEALKIIETKERRARNAILAEEIGSFAADERHMAIKGDAIEEMQKLYEQDHRFDVILTDPPYGVGAEGFNDDSASAQTFLAHNYDDSFSNWQQLMAKFSIASYVLAAPQAHAYVFCDIRNFFALEDMMKDAGWYVWPKPLIWYKGNNGTLPRPEHGPRYTYEAILYAIKGDKKTYKVLHDVLSISNTLKTRHAAEKPVELYTTLLGASAKPGDKILDPFMGSGPIFPSCNITATNAVGIELNAENFAIAQSRLGEKE